MRNAPPTDDAVNGAERTTTPGNVRPDSTEGKMCHRGNATCTDESDTDHACSSAPPESDADVLARAVRWITEGADDGLGTTLTGRMCEVVAEELHARRIKREGRLRAVMYETAARNPTFTNPATEHVAVIRSGADVCGRCGYMITPSNDHSDTCGPRVS